MAVNRDKLLVNLWHAALSIALAYVTVINPKHAALAPLLYAAGAQTPPVNLKPGPGP